MFPIVNPLYDRFGLRSGWFGLTYRDSRYPLPRWALGDRWSARRTDSRTGLWRLMDNRWMHSHRRGCQRDGRRANGDFHVGGAPAFIVHRFQILCGEPKQNAATGVREGIAKFVDGVQWDFVVSRWIRVTTRIRRGRSGIWFVVVTRILSGICLEFQTGRCGFSLGYPLYANAFRSDQAVSAPLRAMVACVVPGLGKVKDNWLLGYVLFAGGDLPIPAPPLAQMEAVHYGKRYVGGNFVLRLTQDTRIKLTV
jgi:hypothetical protein